MRVLVTGGTGFVGGNVVRELCRRGHETVALVRPDSAHFERVTSLGAKPVPGDITDPDSLFEIPSVDAVIHLVGIIRERGRNTFEAVHADGTKHLVDAASRAGARKFVHMSALGTRPDAVSRYHQTKWEGECSVRSYVIPWTIFRPSIVYGHDAWGNESEFVRQMLDLHGKILGIWTPVAGSGASKMQPVWVGDVARCFVDAVTNAATDGRIFELGGPKVHPFVEIQDLLCLARYGKTKFHLHFPLWYMKGLAFCLERILSNPPVTVDQMRMVPEDNTCDMTAANEVFGGEWMEFEKWCRTRL